MQTMGVDQYGHTYHGLGAHPRSELMKRLGTSHAERMFIDKKSGPPVHVGYVMRDLWITLYEVKPFERAV